MKAISLAAAALFMSLAATAGAQTAWKEGVNYFLVSPAHITDLPTGKVEVTEAFSYACPACNVFQPLMRKLKAEMPPNVVVDYLPASFNSAEDWPMFQLAYLTAQSLGIDQRTHDAMFDAVWKSGELGVIDSSTRGLKSHLPSIEDAAKVYNKLTNTPVDKFVAASKSFDVDRRRRAAEDLLRTYKVDRTPTIIVNGKYRLFLESAGGNDELIALVKFLVAKESK
jgi:protein dithiol oxidoreductase (disulfide-forming)